MRKCVLCHMRTTKTQIKACASAQSDQRLCCSLTRLYNISRFYSQNFKTLASFCGCAGRFVSGLVGNSRRHVLSCRGTNGIYGFYRKQSWNSLYFHELCKQATKKVNEEKVFYSAWVVDESLFPAEPTAGICTSPTSQSRMVLLETVPC